MASSSLTQENNQSQARGPAYRITTPRLCIRCWDPKDAGLLKTAADANIEHLLPWASWVKREVEPLENRIAWIRKFRAKFDLGEDFVYGIFDPEETEVIGGTGLNMRQGTEAREIGYWIQQKYEKRGIATEVAAALTKTAFEVDNVKRVHIHCVVENKKSARIPEKLGFVHEGTLRKRLPGASGELSDMMVWTMLSEEYPESIPSKAEVKAFDAIGRQIL